MSRVKRRNRRNRRLAVMILAMIVCLIVVGIVSFRMVKNKVKDQMDEVAQKEVANQESQKQEEEPKMKDAQELDQWNLILVNNQNAIPEDYEVETVEIEDGYSVDERIIEPLKEMLEDCRAEGYQPQIISAFRTRETQQYLYDTTANKADTAVPGHSEHECGLAVDIIDADSIGWADPLISDQEDMPAQKWLMEHCQDYGFILRYPKDKEDITEIIYEPWHYRYVGHPYAEEIMKNGLCLEEYIEQH